VEEDGRRAGRGGPVREHGGGAGAAVGAGDADDLHLGQPGAAEQLRHGGGAVLEVLRVEGGGRDAGDAHERLEVGTDPGELGGGTGGEVLDGHGGSLAAPPRSAHGHRPGPHAQAGPTARACSTAATAPPVHGSPCPGSTVPAPVAAMASRVARLRAESAVAAPATI